MTIYTYTKHKLRYTHTHTHFCWQTMMPPASERKQVPEILWAWVFWDCEIVSVTSSWFKASCLFLVFRHAFGITQMLENIYHPCSCFQKGQDLLFPVVREENRLGAPVTLSMPVTAHLAFWEPSLTDDKSWSQRVQPVALSGNLGLPRHVTPCKAIFLLHFWQLREYCVSELNRSRNLNLEDPWRSRAPQKASVLSFIVKYSFLEILLVM